MKKNKANIFSGLIFSGLLVYSIYLIKTIYPMIAGDNVFLCKNCLNSVYPFLQNIFFVLLLIATASVLVSLIRTFFFKKNLRIICRKSKTVRFLEEKYCLDNKIILFKERDLMAFCLGVFQPKIYLSTQIFKQMTKSEIGAIILHEKQHIDGKDNLVMLFLNLFKTAFFFIPIVTDFVNSVEIQREILADETVVKVTGRNSDIISALRKILESKPNFIYANAFSESFNVEQRVCSLIGKKKRWLSFRYSSVLISFSVFLLLFNITLSRIEIHPQVNNDTMLCIDKGSCQNICQ